MSDPATVGQNAENAAREGRRGGAQGGAPRWPALKYVGFALLLAWHYCLWFISDIFIDTELLDAKVTTAWLVNLGATVISLAVIALLLGRKKHLTGKWHLDLIAAIGMTVCTLALTLSPHLVETPLLVYLISAALGPFEAILWTLWGEHYARNKGRFSMTHIGTVFGITLLLTMAITLVLPDVFAVAFTSALPIASGYLYWRDARCNEKPFPPLLPESASKGAMKSISIVCVISFLASIACYFLAAIIPWEILPTRDVSFTIGVMVGAVLLLVIAGVCHASRSKIDVFKMFPILLVVIVVAFALELADQTLYFPSFILALGVSSILEITLIMYFGILTSKGYVAPALAFALSAGSIRLGIGIGNGLALGYEGNPAFAAAWTPETCLIFICLLTMVLVPLVRQEYAITSLTTTPQTASELDSICNEVAQEFKLSAREGEILHLLAYGHTADSIAKKLVISPYTVNTHIRHIYEKMQIHKRAELLNYINMRRSDS